MNSDVYQSMWDEFKKLGPNAFAQNHYDLATSTSVKSPELWKEFLMMPQVSDWIKSELDIINETELKKLVRNVSTSRSVGQAQLINAMSKLTEGTQAKEGPIFIYSYVPLSTDQLSAPNVQLLREDPFIVNEQDEADE